MYIYFILWFIIHYDTYFAAQVALTVTIKNDYISFRALLIYLHFWSIFCDHKILQNQSYFPCFSPKINHFSKEHWSFLL